MADAKDHIPPILSLKYKKDELIIKEGDYGISIYQIIDGLVQIFTQVHDREVTLALLGPGEVIGEMAFLSRATGTRSASARAMQNTELEVWHPALLSDEYENMPPIIKHIVDETLQRLIRTNRFISRICSPEVEEKPEKEVIIPENSQTYRRRHYRKEMYLPCTYRPVDSSPGIVLNGMIRNISRHGMKMEVRAKNANTFSHDPGQEFYVELTLPGGKELHFNVRVLASRIPQVPGQLSLGMVFTDMKEGTEKNLGFFLMP